MARRRASVLAVVLAVPALLVGACGGSKAATAPTTSPTAAPSSAPTPTIAPPTVAPVATVPPVIEPKDARSTPYLQGNVSPRFPTGPQGSIAVVAVGAVPPNDVGGVSVPVVVRNNTAKPVATIGAVGRATDAGKLIGSGKSQGFEPVLVPPGQVAIGYIFFDGGLPVSAKVTATAAAGPTYGKHVPIAVGETNLVKTDTEQRLVGEVKAGDLPIAGPINVIAMCFDAKGAPVNAETTFLDNDDLAAGQAGTYSIDLPQQPCPGYLVGADGNG